MGSGQPGLYTQGQGELGWGEGWQRRRSPENQEEEVGL